MEEQQTQQQPRYFIAIFGGEFVFKDPVEGGHYMPYEGWTNSIGISKSDHILLYCAEGYSREYSKVVPGTGEVTYVGSDAVHYNYEPLPSQVPLSIIRECFTPVDKVKLRRIHFRWYRLFEIEYLSFRCVLEKAKTINPSSGQ